MPELPEVETTRRGLEPLLAGRTVTDVVVRERRLRWPVPRDLRATLRGRTITRVGRRAKYLLVDLGGGTLILHLGMSGTLRVVPKDTALVAHDHLDVVLDAGQVLRFRDPRRFGAALWTAKDPAEHPLLAELGPEPLGNAFHARHLFDRSRGRRAAVKTFVMDGHVVVGVGNIYASEALHLAGIHPRRAAGRISLERYERLAGAIRTVLGNAIDAGGTTFRDFVNELGRPGYFARSLMAYDRAGEPCLTCGEATIRQEVIGQRSSYFCPRCQR